VVLYVIDRHPLVYQQDNNGVLLPHLRLVHRFPQCFPTIRIDRGAIRFVLSGATLMAPGLTSEGGRLPIPVDRDALAAAAAAAAGGEEVKKAEEAEKKKEEGEEGEDEEDEDAVKVPNEGADEEGHWSRELEKGEPVVIMAEGKEEAAAVGLLVMGTKDVKEKGKGPVMEDAHFLGDGLWRLNVD
jgi:PUA domain protein